MDTNEMYETLRNKGFRVAFSDDHTQVWVGLNRPVCRLEIQQALGFKVNRDQMRVVDDYTIVITEYED